jgi:hypothetical protein
VVGVVGFSAEVVIAASLHARALVEASSRTNRTKDPVGGLLELVVVFMLTPLRKAKNRDQEILRANVAAGKRAQAV